jgi:hypothetical protein
MPHAGISIQQRTLGAVAAWGAFSLGMIYLVTLGLGFLSLKSPQQPIGDPYFSILEILIILLMPAMVASMIVVHSYASPEDKGYSLAALAFMILVAGITCSEHFVILTVSRQIAATGFTWSPLFFSFTWPSVVYALDILAWDLFFALSMLLAAPVFKGDPLENAVRYLMIASGVLSLLGIIGIPLANMNVRDIGIVGYAVVAPVVFLLLALVFGRAKHAPGQVS